MKNNIYLKISILCTLFIGYSTIINCSEIQIICSIPDTIFNVGDKIELTYHLKCDSNLRLIVPDFSTSFAPLEVNKVNFDTIHSEIHITLIPFENGSFEVKPIMFIWEDTLTNRIFSRQSSGKIIQAKDIDLGETPILKEIPAIIENEYIINYALVIPLALLLIMLIVAGMLRRKKH